MATSSSSDDSEKALSDDADDDENEFLASGAECLVTVVVAGRATATKAASGSSVGAPTFAIETPEKDEEDEDAADGELDDDKGSPLSAASSARHSACAASGAREAGAYASSECTRAQRTAAVAWIAAAGTENRRCLRRREDADADDAVWAGPGLLLAAAESSVSSLLLTGRRPPKAMPASGGAGMGVSSFGARVDGRKTTKKNEIFRPQLFFF